MNLAQQIYETISTHVGDEKKIKGLSPTQRKLFKSGEYNPTLNTIKQILIDNGMQTKLTIKQGKTNCEICF